MFQLTKLKERLSASTFVQQVSLTFWTKVAIFVIGFASSVITARYLGPEGRGILAVVMTITAIATQFGNFGLHAANTYFVARDREKLPNIVANTLWLSLVGGFVISAISLAVVYFNQNLIVGVPFVVVFVAVISIPFELFYLLGLNILLGIQRIAAFNRFQLLKGLAVVTAVALLLVALGYGIRAVVLTYTISSIFFALFVMSDLGVSIRNLPAFQVGLFKEMVKYGLRAYLSSLLAFLVLRFDMLMVNFFLGAENAGRYSIAVQIADVLYMLPVTVGMILFPKVSGMKEGSWRFARKATFATAGFMLILCSITGVVARRIIVFVFGSQFEPATGALFWLLPGIYALSISAILMNFLAGRGMPWIVVIAYVAPLITNILLNLYLIPHLGINGAGMSSSIAYVMLVATLALYLRTHPEFTTS